MKVLKTQRLILNQMDLNDALFILDQFSNQTVLKFADFEPYTKIEEAEQLIEKMHLRLAEQTGFRYAIRLKTGQMIGGCGVNRILPVDDLQTAVIGYDMHPDFWGQGYMREAVSAMLSYLKQDLIFNRRVHFVDAEVYSANTASLKLLQHLGFVEVEVNRELPATMLCLRLRLSDFTTQTL